MVGESLVLIRFEAEPQFQGLQESLRGSIPTAATFAFPEADHNYFLGIIRVLGSSGAGSEARCPAGKEPNSGALSASAG